MFTEQTHRKKCKCFYKQDFKRYASFANVRNGCLPGHLPISYSFLLCVTGWYKLQKWWKASMVTLMGPKLLVLRLEVSSFFFLNSNKKRCIEVLWILINIYTYLDGVKNFFFSTLLSNSHSAQNGLLKLEHQGDVLSAAKQLT